MMMHQFSYQRTGMGEKRLLHKDPSAQDPISLGLGLENKEELESTDSNISLEDKVSQLFKIDDVEEFIDMYFDELDEETITSLEEKGSINHAVRKPILKQLIARGASISSRKVVHAFDQLNTSPALRDNQDVIDIAKRNLQILASMSSKYREQEGANTKSERKWQTESDFYVSLAETVAEMGISEDQINLTGELSESLEVMEMDLEDLRAKKAQIQRHIDHVKKFEKQSEEKITWWDKVKAHGRDALRGLGVAGSGGSALALGSYATLSIASGGVGIGVGMLATLGVAAAAGYGASKILPPKHYLELIKKMPVKEAQSVIFQRDLIKNGTARVTAGTKLEEFLLPQSIKVRAGTIINGRKTPVDRTAPKGSIITGKVAENKILTLARLGGKSLSQEELDKKLEEQEKAFTEAQQTYADHKTGVDLQLTEFNRKYDRLQRKVSSYEKQLQRVSGLQEKLLRKKQLMIRQADSAPDGAQTEGFQKKLTDLDKSINEVQLSISESNHALQRAKQAVHELNRIKSAFALNDEASEPMPQGVIKALYAASVSDEDIKTIEKLYSEQDERTRKAQILLGSTTREKMQEALRKATPEQRQEVGAFLKDEHLQKMRGLPEKSLIARNKVLRRLRKDAPELYKMLVAIANLAPNTRYVAPGESKTPEEILREQIKLVKDTPIDTKQEQSADEGLSQSFMKESIELLMQQGAETRAAIQGIQSALSQQQSSKASTAENDKDASEENSKKKTTEQEAKRERLEKLLEAQEKLSSTLSDIKKVEHLKGFAEQFTNVHQRTVILELMVKLPTGLSQEDINKLSTLSMDEMLKGNAMDPAVINRLQVGLEYLKDHCVMSRFPLYHQNADMAVGNNKKINPSQLGLYDNARDYQLYTTDELRESIERYTDSIKSRLRKSSFKEIPEFTPSGSLPLSIFFNVGLMNEENVDPQKIQPALLDVVVANLEGLDEALENGMIFEKNNGLRLKEGSSYYFYDGPDKASPEDITPKKVVGVK